MTLTKAKSHVVGFQGLAPTMVYAVENAFQVGTQRPVHSSCLPLGRDGGQASLLANCSEDEDIPSQVPDDHTDCPGRVPCQVTHAVHELFISGNKLLLASQPLTQH